MCGVPFSLPHFVRIRFRSLMLNSQCSKYKFSYVYVVLLVLLMLLWAWSHQETFLFLQKFHVAIEVGEFTDLSVWFCKVKGFWEYRSEWFCISLPLFLSLLLLWVGTGFGDCSATTSCVRMESGSWWAEFKWCLYCNVLGWKQYWGVCVGEGGGTGQGR